MKFKIFNGKVLSWPGEQIVEFIVYGSGSTQKLVKQFLFSAATLDLILRDLESSGVITIIRKSTKQNIYTKYILNDQKNWDIKSSKVYALSVKKVQRHIEEEDDIAGYLTPGSTDELDIDVTDYPLESERLECKKQQQSQPESIKHHIPGCGTDHHIARLLSELSQESMYGTENDFVKNVTKKFYSTGSISPKQIDVLVAMLKSAHELSRYDTERNIKKSCSCMNNSKN